MRLRLARWFLTVLICVLFGWGLGYGFDRILFQISYDYVFAPGYCARWGLNWGLFSGALLGLIDDWFPVTQLSWGKWFAHWGMLVCIPAASVACGVCMALYVRSIPVTSITELAPPARHAFCTGLVDGARWGTVVFIVGILYLRRQLAITAKVPSTVRVNSAEQTQPSS